MRNAYFIIDGSEELVIHRELQCLLPRPLNEDDFVHLRFPVLNQAKLDIATWMEISELIGVNLSYQSSYKAVMPYAIHVKFSCEDSYREQMLGLVSGVLYAALDTAWEDRGIHDATCREAKMFQDTEKIWHVIVAKSDPLQGSAQARPVDFPPFFSNN